jgi:hypothetical protein
VRGGKEGATLAEEFASTAIALGEIKIETRRAYASRDQALSYR